MKEDAAWELVERGLITNKEVPLYLLARPYNFNELGVFELRLYRKKLDAMYLHERQRIKERIKFLSERGE